MSEPRILGRRDLLRMGLGAALGTALMPKGALAEIIYKGDYNAPNGNVYFFTPEERWLNEHDDTVTGDYKRYIGAKDPLPTLMRSMVAQLESLGYDPYSADPPHLMRSFGSANLIDDQGTIVCAMHEIYSPQVKLTFVPKRNKKLKAGQRSVTATLLGGDLNVDVAYLKIDDPSFVAANKLTPVDWGKPDRPDPPKFAPMFVMGFIHPSVDDGRLCLLERSFVGYAPRVPYVGKKHIIVTEYLGKSIAYPWFQSGLSGAGLFDAKTGEFRGIVNLSSYRESRPSGSSPNIFAGPSEIAGYFTPADALWNGYLQARPDIATARGLKPVTLVHPEAEIHLRPPEEVLARQALMMPPSGPPVTGSLKTPAPR